MGAGERVLHDTFFLQAKAAGYLTRAAYKLKAIQAKHAVVPRGGLVLDLGCAPGAWMQVACECLGPPAAGGRVVGVDLSPVAPPAGHKRWDAARAIAMQADAFELATLPSALLRCASPSSPARCRQAKLLPA